MSKTFYCIANSELISTSVRRNFELLTDACRRRSLTFTHITVPSTAYSVDDIPLLGEGGLYRLTTGLRCAQYTLAIKARNPQLQTWEIAPPPRPIASGIPWNQAIVGLADGIACIPTLFGITSTVDADLLDRIQAHLGGFPVILKMIGASHGFGVMRIDSAQSLKTVLGHFLNPENEPRYALRKYIADAQHYRLVVIDEQVISTITYETPTDDFRTNATPDIKVAKADAPTVVANLAVAAVTSADVRFGGVDILVDRAGNSYVAEVNTPCNFSRNQDITGVDVADAIVSMLCR